MSDQKPLIVRSYEQENTTVIKYRLVKHGSGDNQVVAAVDATAPIIGVADESADSTTGNPVGVVMAGIAKLVIAAASNKGGAVTAEAGGKGLVTTTKGNYAVGWLLETTTVSNQVAKVMVSPFLYPTIA